MQRIEFGIEMQNKNDVKFHTTYMSASEIETTKIKSKTAARENQYLQLKFIVILTFDGTATHTLAHQSNAFHFQFQLQFDGMRASAFAPTSTHAHTHDSHST